MSGHPLHLLLTALGTPNSCFVLGAGASSPEVPTIAQLPDRLAPYAAQLGSFPARAIPDSPLRHLIAPLIGRARVTTSLDEWKAAGMTDSTIAVLLEHMIAAAHWQPLVQYSVFRLLPTNAAVVSFNWDGLAFVRCPQAEVLHPHGRLRPRHVVPGALDDALDTSQLIDGPDSRNWILPGLVLPGEEEAPRLRRVREKVLRLWESALSVTVIGYSFGLNSGLRYDQVWLDTFVEAMKLNKRAPLHILSPDAEDLRGHLVERIKRTINVHAWPYRWNALAAALETTSRRARARTIDELRVDAAALDILARTVGDESVAAYCSREIDERGGWAE